MKLILCLLLVFSNICFAGETVVSEDKALSSSELKQFERIKKTYPDFLYSNTVRTYYSKDAVSNTKTPIYSEMVFSKENGLIGEQFISYSVTYQPESSVIMYSFDAGTASRGEGNIVVTKKSILRTEYSCGVTSCGVSVYKNGKEFYSE